MGNLLSWQKTQMIGPTNRCSESMLGPDLNMRQNEKNCVAKAGVKDIKWGFEIWQCKLQRELDESNGGGGFGGVGVQ